MDKKEALQKCMKLCSSKEYSPREIIDKVQVWGLSENDGTEIVDHLIKEKFIDVYRYARFYVNDKIKFNKWGRVKIGILLKQKQIPENAIKEAFEQFDEATYSSVLRLELQKKLKSIKDTDPFIVKGKLFQYASGKGFENDLIQKEINYILK